MKFKTTKHALLEIGTSDLQNNTSVPDHSALSQRFEGRKCEVYNVKLVYIIIQFQNFKQLRRVFLV